MIKPPGKLGIAIYFLTKTTKHKTYAKEAKIRPEENTRNSGPPLWRVATSGNAPQNETVVETITFVGTYTEIHSETRVTERWCSILSIYRLSLKPRSQVDKPLRPYLMGLNHSPPSMKNAPRSSPRSLPKHSWQKQVHQLLILTRPKGIWKKVTTFWKLH